MMMKRFITITIMLLMAACLANADILNLADITVQDTEPNNDQNTAQVLAFEPNNDVVAIGIEGHLSSDDIDVFRCTQDPKGSITLRAELPNPEDQDILALADGTDGIIGFVTVNSLWQYASLDPNTEPELIKDASALATAADVEADTLEITDLTSTTDGQMYLTLGQTGKILHLNNSDQLSLLVDTPAILAVTGETSADLSAVAYDPNHDNFYAADEVSGSVLKITASGVVTSYTSGTVLRPTIESAIAADLINGNTLLTTDLLAQTSGVFVPTSLIYLSNNPHYNNGYYITQFSRDIRGNGGTNGGDGTITRIEPNETTPTAAKFTKLFDPTKVSSDLTNTILRNPTSLAVADPNNIGFDRKMFLGTFGTDMGSDFDSRVFIVEPNGTVRDFVTAYKDQDGLQAQIGGVDVNGFYDVIDMSFSPGGVSPFGNYLYILSENNGSKNSDIWRINANGIAELFVENAGDFIGSLVFDTAGTYGGYLYVASWNTGKILRVSSNGQVTTFHQMTENPTLLDMVFAPADSVFAGKLLITVTVGEEAHLITLDANGTTETVWTTGLDTGAIPSGDMVFNPTGELVILYEGDKGLRRINYAEVFDYQFTDLQIRNNSDRTFDAPYALITTQGQPRLMRLSDSGVMGDIRSEASPKSLISTGINTSGKDVAVVFDPNGVLYTYSSAVGQLRKSTRTSGSFGPFTNVLAGTKIATATTSNKVKLTNAKVHHLLWTDAHKLYGLARNGAATAYDDTVVLLGSLGVFNTVTSVMEYGDLTADEIKINLTGPDVSDPNMTVVRRSPRNHTWRNLAGGDYYITVKHLGTTRLPVDYDLIISLSGDFQKTYTLSDANAPLELTTVEGNVISLDITGAGRAELNVSQRPGGKVVSLNTLTLSDTRPSTTVKLTFTDPNDPNKPSLDELVLGGPLKTLRIEADINQINADEGTRGNVLYAELASVTNVNTPRITFMNMNLKTGSLGENSKNIFNAAGLRKLTVNGDINGVTFFNPYSTNAYQSITVKGIIQDSTFFGSSLQHLIINNNQEETDALTGTTIRMQGSPSGTIGTISVEQGNVADCTIVAPKRITRVEVLAGDLLNSTINGTRYIKNIYIQGDVDSDCDITANADRRARIDEIISGGNFAGTINTSEMSSVLIGFDPNGQRPEEDSDSDFSGTITALYGMGTLSVTGMISDAEISANLGSIYGLYAEDGLDNIAVTAFRRVERVMVGYIGGNRNQIANEEANVSGSISTSYPNYPPYAKRLHLGRLYYTGTLGDLPDTGPVETISLPASRGPIVDDRP